MSIRIPMFFALIFSACSGETETPIMQYMPHMSNTPVLKAQRGYAGRSDGSSMIMPPEGTIPRGFKPYKIRTDVEAGRRLVNPLPITKEVLRRGQNRYETYCLVCHGEKGYGDGPVVPPFPTPKSLQSNKIRTRKDGYIYHVITKGSATMPSYATQISRKDRWAIIHYLRVLQRSEHPRKSDIKQYQQKKVGGR